MKTYNEKIMKKLSPDFLQIPYKLVCDEELSPMDKMVYGGVYFFSKMRGEACYASNTLLADLLKTTSNTVSRSLKKLEEKRYIFRTYRDTESRTSRLEIIPLISMGKIDTKRLKRGTRNGIASKQTEGTRNGITPIPNGIASYTKRNTTKTPKKRQNTSDKPLNKAKNSKKGGYTKRNIDIEDRENINKNIHRELIFHPEKSGEKIKKPNSKPIGKKDKNKTPPKSPPEDSKSDGAKLNDVIALFLEIFPGDFTGSKSAFKKIPTREAVAGLMKRYSHDEIKELIRKYNAGISDPYRPGVGTVYEFCTSKLAKVEAYVKKTGGLWAQRSISSPEHSKEFDSRVSEIMEKNREEARLEKEKWEWEEKANYEKN